jgi:hypothetical protein
MDFEHIEWHDGNLFDVKIQIDYNGESNIVIIVELYEEPINAVNRDRYLITCKNLFSFNFNCDVEELFDNKSAGNISNGYLKDNTLRIYLCDGYIEIKANQFNIEKC